MSHSPYLQHENAQRRVEAVVKRLFPAPDTRVERVWSGISTYVYRIFSQCQTYYLRILPDTKENFTPEIAALTQLRKHHINVPEVIYFEHHNETLGRAIMVEAEIKGKALSRTSLPREVLARVVVEAGRDLARVNALTVDGFGWIQSQQIEEVPLRGRWPTFRAFALEHRKADLIYLRRHILKPHESMLLERVLERYDSWLDVGQGYLAHGDFDSTHIFQDRGRYTGIIDFGEVRGGNRWYDLAHFRIRDGARPPYRLFPALERGYKDLVSFPPNYEPLLRFTSVLINIRALSRAFQTRSPDSYIWRQLDILREDLAALT
jgi:aminoglycoside phosphotransferase (APT) family kinase protein